MSANYLAIFLDSPLQAWGVSSRFTRRDTLPHPTKSGVLGMISAAMGVDKHSQDEASLLAPLIKLKLSSYQIPKKNYWGTELPMGRLEDFHTVGAGYNSKDPIEKQHIPHKASGGASSNAVITKRDYLLDAQFLIILEGELATLEEIQKALKQPKWGLWLGRKSCVPATPVFASIDTTAQAAAESILSKLSYGEFQLSQFKHYTEQESSSSYTIKDQPEDYADKLYSSRPICYVQAKKTPTTSP